MLVESTKKSYLCTPKLLLWMTAHTPHDLSHPFPWSFPRSNSSITEVESRACKLALPIYGDVADCNGKEKDYESGFHYYGARYYWSELLTGWLSVDPMSDKYPSISPYAYCAWNPIKLMDSDGRDWVLVTGDKVRWYGGEKGDRSNLMHTYNSASGYMDEHKDFRQAKYQHKKNCGPTPAGEYRINLVPDPNRVANANYDDGQLIRNKDGCIELIPESFKGRYFEYTYESWGKRRALLQPVNVTGAGSNERDNNSYYLHDSEKCYTHGCTEVESEFFDQLIEYRNAGNKKISVVVEYPSDNHKTYSNACE